MKYILFVFLILFPSSVFAEDNFRLENHGVITWSGGLGTGGSIDIPVYRPNNSFMIIEDLAIRGNLDVVFSDVSVGGISSIFQYYPSLVVQWNVKYNERVSVVPEFGLSGVIEPHKWQGFVPVFNLGIKAHVVGPFYGVVRTGTPMASTIGFSLSL